MREITIANLAVVDPNSPPQGGPTGASQEGGSAVRHILLIAAVFVAALGFNASSTLASNTTHAKANASVSLYRPFPNGINPNNAALAWQQVSSRAAWDDQYSSVIANQTGAPAYVASQYQVVGYGNGMPGTTNSALSGAGTIVPLADHAGSGTARVLIVMNITTSKTVAFMVRCGNPRLNKTPYVAPIPWRNFSKGTVLRIHRTVTKPVQLVCPSGQTVSGTLEATLNEIIHGTTWGKVQGSLIERLQLQLQANLTVLAKLKCGAAPPPVNIPVPVPTPQPQPTPPIIVVVVAPTCVGANACSNNPAPTPTPTGHLLLGKTAYLDGTQVTLNGGEFGFSQSVNGSATSSTTNAASGQSRDLGTFNAGAVVQECETSTGGYTPDQTCITHTVVAGETYTFSFVNRKTVTTSPPVLVSATATATASASCSDGTTASASATASAEAATYAEAYTAAYALALASADASVSCSVASPPTMLVNNCYQPQEDAVGQQYANFYCDVYSPSGDTITVVFSASYGHFMCLASTTFTSAGYNRVYTPCNYVAPTEIPPGGNDTYTATVTDVTNSAVLAVSATTPFPIHDPDVHP